MATNSKRYAFGTVSGRENPKGPSINAVYFPEPAELQSYHDAVKELNQWARQETFALVEYSHHQFKLTVVAVQQAFVKQSVPPQAHNFILNLNATFLNFLAMMRLYLDHTEALIKRSSTTKDTEVLAFSEATAKEYDGYFAYRFAYKLRNYAQHCGFPIGGLHSGGMMINHDPNNIERNFDVTFKRDELLANYDSWKEPLKTELKALDVEFSVLPIADGLLESLQRIHNAVLKGHLSQLKQAAVTVNEMASRSIKDGVGGAPHLIGVPENPEDFKKSSLNLTLARIPLELVLAVQQIEKSLSQNEAEKIDKP